MMMYNAANMLVTIFVSPRQFNYEAILQGKIIWKVESVESLAPTGLLVLNLFSPISQKLKLSPWSIHIIMTLIILN